jgi:hypothetical protein
LKATNERSIAAPLRKIEQQVRFAQIFAARCAFQARKVEYNRWRDTLRLRSESGGPRDACADLQVYWCATLLASEQGHLTDGRF